MIASGSAESAVVAGRLIGQPVIDLVGDVPEPEPATFCCDRGNRLGRHDHAGRVRRAHRQDTGQRLLGMGLRDQLRRQREARLRPDFDGNRLQPQRDQDVAVGRIARSGDRDAIAGLETGEEGEDEAARGSGRDHDALGRQLDAIGITVMPGDALAQRIGPQRLGVADAPILQRAAGCGTDRGRCGGRGLADLHMHDRTTLPLDGGGLVHHIHDDEGRNALRTRRDLRLTRRVGVAMSFRFHGGCPSRALLQLQHRREQHQLGRCLDTSVKRPQSPSCDLTRQGEGRRSR